MTAARLHGALFLSGAAALAYELLWLRAAGTLIGHTVYASAVVIAVFLGGLALGAWVAGRALVGRRPSARLYACIEVGIAATATLVPLVLDRLAPVFGHLHRAGAGGGELTLALHLALVAMVIALPTVLMGATLPVAVGLARDRDLGRVSGSIYGANAVGSAAGAVALAFWVLPALGASASGLAFAACNLAAAALVAGMGERPSETTQQPRAGQFRLPSEPRAVLGIYFGTGVFSLWLELAWARVLSLSYGSTLYGFAATLAAFVLGLSAGSFLAPRLRPLRRAPLTGFAGLQLAVALSAVLLARYMDRVPEWVLRVMADPEAGFVAVAASHLGIALATVGVPTLAMGASYAVVTGYLGQWWDREHAAGTAYAVNAAGNILGSLSGGLGALAFLGMQRTLEAVGVGFAGLALAGLVRVPTLKARRRLALAFLPVLMLGIGLELVREPWKPGVMTSAPYFFGYRVAEVAERGAGRDPADAVLGEVVRYAEGPTAVVAVRRFSSGQRLLYVGGIPESGAQAPLHRWLGHLGMLLHGSVKRALVVGLGVGHTLAAVLEHPVERVDCLEIAQEVVDMSRQEFSAETGDVLDDPRVRLWVQDARTHVRHADVAYDLVVSQPSYPWTTGAARLFTREYFADLASRLRPGGVAVAWFTTESEASARAIERAWVDVFPDAHVFAGLGRFRLSFLVGFEGSRGLEADRIARALDEPAVSRAVARFGVRTAEDVLRFRRAGADEMRARTEDAVVNTDDNGFVELDSFRDFVERRAELWESEDNRGSSRSRR